jgi:hypothetical protein
MFACSSSSRSAARDCREVQELIDVLLAHAPQHMCSASANIHLPPVRRSCRDQRNRGPRLGYVAAQFPNLLTRYGYRHTLPKGSGHEGVN